MKTCKTFFLSLVLILSGSAIFAQNVDPVGKDKIANGGYDFVAYFSDSKAVKGSKEFVYELNGVKYLFASAEHRDLFKSNPEKYLPVCDGYCAWGVAEKGIKVPVNPETFKIVDGKLYLFFNGKLNGSPLNTLPEWNKNEENLLKQLPANWSKLSKK
ncbi:MAG TPA: YHS domain-containing (seleno)protein [Chitinophagaceae bacterium]|nr:YHS domain-containing (seleno)protein [Chitinophagaceae bacterium]